MPTVIFGDGLCSENPVTPQVGNCDDAARLEWKVLDKPVGSSISISDDTALEPEFDASQDGAYELQLCCYFEEGVVFVPSIVAQPELSCPLGVVAGEPATLRLNGCVDGNVENITFGGVATGLTFDASGVGTLTTDATMPGTANASVDCVVFDEDGNETRSSFDCEVEVIAADTELVCTVSPALEVAYEPCGESCECQDVTVVFDCDEATCDSAQVGLVFKDCPPCEPEPDCDPLEFATLQGSAISAGFCDDLIDCCDEEYCCDEDMPALFWNDLCNCPGWTVEGPAAEGSSVYNICSCNPGQQWCFEGSATLVFRGPPQQVDTLIIWGHNISDGEVTVTPLETISGNTASVGVVNDNACIEGYTAPLIMNFTDPTEPFPQEQVNDLIVEEVSVTITSNTGGLVCINQIFLGQKLFFPDDRMPESFQNPHDGTDRELVVKDSECGPLSRTLNHVPIEMSFEIDCVTDRWLKEVWRPYLRYAEKHGVLFQHSRNNCPNDLFNGSLVSPVGPSRYISLNRYAVTLAARGFITQPQSKALLT